MPPETPSFPSTTITWMYVLYLPTFPPHHPSFHRSCFPRQGLHASPQPTFPAREGRPGTCRGAPGCRGSAAVLCQPAREQEESAWSCPLPLARAGPLQGSLWPPTSASVLVSLGPGLLVESVLASWVRTTPPKELTLPHHPPACSATCPRSLLPALPLAARAQGG